MKNRRPWLIFLLLVLAWSVVEIYPPTSRDLIQEFSRRAENQDAAFTNILRRAESLQQAKTNSSEFADLLDAIGTNDVQPYFQFVSATNELHPTEFILNRLQRDAAGRIKLGLDLQGGTSFLVEMDTNYLANAEDENDTNRVARAPDTSGALSQAIEVLRKRVDAFGVAEPVIQPAGANRILIQLPGLSEADKASARSQITKAAYLEFRMVKDDSDKIVDAIQHGEPVAIPPGYELLKHVQQMQSDRRSLKNLS